MGLDPHLCGWDPHLWGRTPPSSPFSPPPKNYDTTESKLRREFEVYGPIKRVSPQTPNPAPPKPQIQAPPQNP